MEEIRLIRSGDRSLHVRVGEGDHDHVAARVARVESALRSAKIPGVIDLTPGSTTVQVSVDPDTDPDGIEAAVRAAALRAVSGPDSGSSRATVVIPVCYGGDLGPDLGWLAAKAKLGEAAAAALHHSADHTVRFLGFSPGFAYMAGLPERLHASRLEQPRSRVRPGSVAIAGGRTGIYPHATPGGWRLIGATPLRVFDATRTPASMLRAGDRVRFEPISRAEFDRLDRSCRGNGDAS